jgi:hypothetical protein
MKSMAMLYAAAGIALAGVGSYALTRPADAQGAPPVAVSQQAHDGQAGRDRPDWGHGPQGMHHRLMMARRNWGLFAPVRDKALSVTDVQTIAQAMLLRHGNHTWKVANVAQNQDNTVSFAFTTADGGVVARFAIDTQSGHVRRLG